MTEKCLEALSYSDKDYLDIMCLNIVTNTFEHLKNNSKTLVYNDLNMWLIDFLEEYEPLNAYDNNKDIFGTVLNFKYNEVASLIFKRKVYLNDLSDWVILKFIKKHDEIYIYKMRLNNNLFNDLNLIYENTIEKHFYKSTKYKNSKYLSEYIDAFDNRKIGVMHFHILKDQKQLDSILFEYLDIIEVVRTTKNDIYCLYRNCSKQDFEKLVKKINNQLVKNNLLVGFFNKWSGNCKNLKQLIDSCK